MSEESTINGGSAPLKTALRAGLLPQIATMLRALWISPVRARLIWLSLAILTVILVTSWGQIRLNNWNQPFYDALSRRDFHEFMVQLGRFCVIAGGLLVLNVAQRWLGEMIKLVLREGLVHDLVHEWLAPRRAFRLASAGTIGVNPDQRMHEDARHLTELSADLGIGLLQASILLAIFVGVLWHISADFSFQWHGRSVQIPGYMVWAAVVYAGSASLLSYWVGRPLVERNADRYAREADLRFSLVRVNEHVDAVALARGEAEEARRIELDFTGVLAAMRRLVAGITRLTWVTAGYGWFTLVAPILAAAPIYFSGGLTFGGLMMAAGAFQQVQSSLRWFVDNFSAIADWRATLLRVADFRRAVLTADETHRQRDQIDYAEGDAGRIRIEHLEIASPSGCVMLEEPVVEILAGQRVLIVGGIGPGKDLLFRAIAGLWPYGAGRIVVPRGETFMYVPRTPYLPPGTLREVLAYPRSVSQFESEAFMRALARLGLERLAPRLDESRRWDRELTEDGQKRLMFARVLLHEPEWVLIDEVLEALDSDTRALLRRLAAEDLAKTGIIHIGRAESAPDGYAQVLHLAPDPTLRRLPRLKLTDGQWAETAEPTATEANGSALETSR